MDVKCILYRSIYCTRANLLFGFQDFASIPMQIYGEVCARENWQSKRSEFDARFIAYSSQLLEDTLAVRHNYISRLHTLEFCNNSFCSRFHLSNRVCS